MPNNRTLILRSRPEGMVKVDDFDVVDRPIPTPQDGEILVQNYYASLDPGLRKMLGATDGYWIPTPLGEPMVTNTIGKVLESRHPDYKPGDLVTGTALLQEYSAYAPGPMTWKVDPASRLSLSNSLGILGATGLTAYVGLLEVGRPLKGETVLVSGAAGAVGSAVGQIAKIKGCRVVGLAGGPEKCRRLIEEFGFDGAIDYKGKTREQLTAEIRALCPQGVDVYFENVGGIQLDAALACMNWGGHIPVCGLISEYNQSADAEPMVNLFSIVGKVLRVEGFLSFTYKDIFPRALREIEEWILSGKLVYREHIADGIEAAPATFITLFTGQNDGKTVVKLADPATN